METTILKMAKDYQEISRKIKDLESKQKPLKDSLLEYAKNNKEEFDKSFQLKFPNGTYISQRVSDCLEADAKQKAKLIEETADEYLEVKLDEKAIIKEAPKNDRLRKLLTKLGIKVGQKETFAIYAG